MTSRVRAATGAPKHVFDLARTTQRVIDETVQSFRGIRTITASETLTKGDVTVLVNAASGAVTAALPPAAEVTGQTLHIKKIDASGNAVTIDPSGSETIDGAATKATATQWASYSIQSNGTGWFII